MTPDLLADLPASFDQGHLASGDGHQLWYAQYGRPQGMPLFWLHGGPGSASSLRHIGLIDLERYRLVLADQRGCGRSLPLGTLHRNDTGLLVSDIDRLRTHLQIKRMVIGGGSWGATLALLYAAQHPASVAALLLRAPFLASRAEILAFFAPPLRGPAGEWADLAALAPPSARQNLLPWLAQQLATSGHDQCARIALGWSRHERRREVGDAALMPRLADDAMIARYRIQAHYLLHGCFIGTDWLRAAVPRLHGLPTAILHGDADQVCPPRNARLLRRCLPGSSLRMVGDVGHDPFHPGMVAALTEALECYVRKENFDGWGSKHG